MNCPRLKPGDRVRIVSPASPPDEAHVAAGVKLLESWELRPEIASHAFDRHGHYLAGRDEDRLADLNEALRDPGIRAIWTTCGGKGSWRIAHALDFEAAARDPKPLIGFSDITALHLALWHKSQVAGFHGPHASWDRRWCGPDSGEQLRRALMDPRPVTIHQDPGEFTAGVVIEGKATGTLLGGNLVTIGRNVGWNCPSFDGAILLIEAVDTFIGQIDATLTQLIRAGCLEGVRGVAVGQFIRSAEAKAGKWSAIDVLLDRLSLLNVPVLGGLPIGHGPQPPTIPLGTMATLDTNSRTLTIEPGTY